MQIHTLAKQPKNEFSNQKDLTVVQVQDHITELDNSYI